MTSWLKATSCRRCKLKMIIFSLQSFVTNWTSGLIIDIKPIYWCEQQLVSSSRSPGGSSVLSVVVSGALCKTFGPVASKSTFTVAAPVPATGPCLFTCPATVTASPMLHYTRNSSCVNWVVLKSSRRSHFMLQNLVLMISIADDLEIMGYIWKIVLPCIWAGYQQVDSQSVARQLVSAALHSQRAVQHVAFLRANWK